MGISSRLGVIRYDCGVVPDARERCMQFRVGCRGRFTFDVFEPRSSSSSSAGIHNVLLCVWRSEGGRGEPDKTEIVAICAYITFLPLSLVASNGN